MQNKIRKLTLILATVFVFSFGDKSVSLNALDVSQAIGLDGDALYVVLSIKNSTDDAILLETLPANRERTLGREFLLTSEGREILFVGAVAKLRPYRESDFFELKGGAILERKIRIDLDYEFLAGRHRYDVTYMYLVYNRLTKKVESGYAEKINFEYVR